MKRKTAVWEISIAITVGDCFFLDVTVLRGSILFCFRKMKTFSEKATIKMILPLF